MNFIQNIPENLELLARHVVEGFIIGLHRSPFHGFSVEFAEHRLFNPGDPIRHIDWRVYGRTEKLFLKKFEEETNLRCTLAIDASSSMYFPQDEAGVVSKIQFSAICAAAIATLLKRQLDATGLTLFAEDIFLQTATRSSTSHHRMLLTELDKLMRSPMVRGRKSGLAQSLHTIAEAAHRRSLIVIFSDALDDTGEMEALYTALQHLRYNRHEVVFFHVMHGEKEIDFAFENRPYQFVDMETGETIRLQPAAAAEGYRRQIAALSAELELRCNQYGIDRVPVDLRQPVEAVLQSFLAKRARLM